MQQAFVLPAGMARCESLVLRFRIVQTYYQQGAA